VGRLLISAKWIVTRILGFWFNIEEWIFIVRISVLIRFTGQGNSSSSSISDSLPQSNASSPSPRTIPTASLVLYLGDLATIIASSCYSSLPWRSTAKFAVRYSNMRVLPLGNYRTLTGHLCGLTHVLRKIIVSIWASYLACRVQWVKVILFVQLKLLWGSTTIPASEIFLHIWNKASSDEIKKDFTVDWSPL